MTNEEFKTLKIGEFIWHDSPHTEHSLGVVVGWWDSNVEVLLVNWICAHHSLYFKHKDCDMYMSTSFDADDIARPERITKAEAISNDQRRI